MIGQRQFWGHSRSNPPLIILLAIFSSALFLLVLLIASVSHDDFVGLQNEDTSLSPVKKCGGIGGKKSSFYCCAHRGARILAPENTLSSFLKAIEVGANCIELDIHRTADGIIVVAHGRTVREKLLGGKVNSSVERVEDMGWEFMKTLDAGSWFSETHAGEKISSFEDVLKKLWNFPILLVIEMKYEQCSSVGSGKSGCFEKGVWESQYARDIVEILSRINARRRPNFELMFSSFNHLLVDELAAELSQLKNQNVISNIAGLAYIFGPKDDLVVEKWHEGVNWIALHDSLVRTVKFEPQEEKKIISWVTDSFSSLQEQVEAGVSAVTTNDATLCPSLCNWISGRNSRKLVSI